MALASKPESRMPLAFNDSRLLELLAEKLPEHMAPEDVQALLSELRGELYVNIGDDSAQNLHSITLNCHRCTGAAQANLPVWNLVDPDVVFVADKPFTHKPTQDYFIKVLKEVGFSSSRVCLTYVNRCLIKGERKHTEEQVQNCLPFLQTELQILKPKLIVPLGLVPSQATLGASIALKEERGVTHWLGPWAILPTFSPAYVLNGADHLEDIFISDIQKAHDYVYSKNE